MTIDHIWRCRAPYAPCRVPSGLRQVHPRISPLLSSSSSCRSDARSVLHGSWSALHAFVHKKSRRGRETAAASSYFYVLTSTLQVQSSVARSEALDLRARDVRHREQQVGRRLVLL